MYILNDIIKTLEAIAPPSLAESWDNVGLMIGSRQQKVNKVLCALDINDEVVREAVQSDVQCIVTHHPLIFKPLHTIDFDTPKGRVIRELISHDISVYSMHTNYDIVKGGINDILCGELGIRNVEVLHISHVEAVYKIAVYVPEANYEEVRNTIITQDICDSGNYKGCTFTMKGEGTFMPLQGSKPYIGKINQLENVKERKIEFIAYQKDIKMILTAITKVHPYEEMAYDVYALNKESKESGIGRYGKLDEALTLEELINKIKQIFNLPYVRVTDTTNKKIHRVAVCSGSGASYIKRASEVADAYITADIKFHEAQEASALGISVIDIGHYASENRAMQHIAAQMNNRLKGLCAISSSINAEVIHIK